jgi:hypothetical protein
MYVFGVWGVIFANKLVVVHSPDFAVSFFLRRDVSQIFCSWWCFKYSMLRFSLPPDIDECADNANNSCHKDANCQNTPGSFTCSCNNGFTGNGTSCAG